MTRKPIRIKITDDGVELGPDGITQAIEHGTLEFSADGVWCTLVLLVEPEPGSPIADLDVDRLTVTRDASIVDTLSAFEIERAGVEGTAGNVWENILSFLRTRAGLNN